MSFRGGRGGGRGGFGGRPVFFGNDIKPDFRPADRYPTFTLPLQTPPTEFEARAIRQFMQYRRELRESAFFVVERKRGVVEYEGGINDGIKRYSDRYLKRRKTGKNVSDHPYIIEFFPDELHATLGVKSSATSTKPKRRQIDLAQFREAEDEAEGADGHEGGEGDEDATGAANANGDDEDPDNDDGDDDEDEFEEDEEGDYNAEKYFDDGEDDDFDDGGDEEAAY
ncbi:DNA-directed RNA polymerase III, subunit Rpc31 [Limtongia smithiae]|uniref:DNA-directed RNA polymerase III, subunit Rpc31 n=1 Tax=Limtongia smithiae TaxID=1125753 RepID=UPI0034CE071E